MTLALGVLTAVNIALACFGVSMAIMSPMMFDRGGQDETLLWGVFWSDLGVPRPCRGLRGPALAVAVAAIASYRAGDVRHSERLPRHLGRDPLHLLLAAGANGPQQPSGVGSAGQSSYSAWRR